MSFAQCTATSKRTGNRCKARAVLGRTVCYHHGGATPRGFDLPQTKIGRYSRDLPARLSSRYQEALSDPDLLAMREEVALVDARLGDLLKRVDSGESGLVWDLLQKVYHEFVEVRGLGNEGAREAAAKLTEMARLIQRGTADRVAWGEIGDLLEQRRKLVESERKRLLDLQLVITADKAMLLMAAVVDVIRRNVTDKHILAAISADITKLVSIGAGREA